jgi:hypothetical protein
VALPRHALLAALPPVAACIFDDEVKPLQVQ